MPSRPPHRSSGTSTSPAGDIPAPEPTELVARFRRLFPDSQGQPVVVVRAPGRVNLIGEHTDYNEGFVMPVAVDRSIMIVGCRAPASQGRIVRLISGNFDQHAQFDLDRRRKEERMTWVNYPQGVADVLEREGHRLPGMNLLVFGNVPLGSGMSSSAAFEVAATLLFRQIAGFDLTPLAGIQIAKRAENEFVGVACGIMDQFISWQGQAGHALLLDCRSLEYEQVEVSLPDIVLGVCHSGVSRGLAASAYNQRRSECEQGVTLLKEHLPTISSLRDVSTADLDRYEHILPPVVRRRCRHVVDENARTLEAAAVLRAGDLTRLGTLFAASHASLRDLYEVSSPELDALVEVASAVPGVVAARLTGAGFGGCTVNLVRNDAWDTFVNAITTIYPRRTNRQPTVWRCQITDGARILHV